MTTVEDERVEDRKSLMAGWPRWVGPALGIVIFLLVAAPLGSIGGKLSDVQRNDSASYLPEGAEATAALAASKRFTGLESTPAIIIYTRPSGITEADRIQLTLVTLAIAEHLNTRLAGPPRGPVVSDDGKAAQIIVPFAGSDPKPIREDVRWLRQHAAEVPDLEVHVAGPAGAVTDLVDVFGAVNGVLLLVTAAVVLLILVLAYRSPILPFVVLAVAGTALGVANGTAYLLAKANLITISGDAQGILDVLVLGAGTDYALLLAARFREELRRREDRYEAMRAAWRAALPPIAATGGWARVARGVGQRPRLVWAVTALALVGLALGLTRLQAEGVPRTKSFLAEVDSNAGQELLSEHFPASAATPAVIVANADRRDEILDVASRVPGVAKATAYVDPLEAYDARRLGKPAPGPKVVDGLVRFDASLDVPVDSARAAEVIRALRAAVHAVPGGGARVGGYTATNLDVQETAQRDRLVIIPLVLAVVFVILMLVLRAIVASLVLIGTVILSFLATLGVSGVVFRDVIGFAGADSSFPLFAFVFLVALGVDYNIFLMTRVREETARRGHRDGTLTGLALTGGVITSAGVVLAATFAALAVLPLVFLAELAFAVAFGVLLDTLVVRSLLVPALTLDIGRAVWWPSALRRGAP